MLTTKYTKKETARIWSEDNYFQTQLSVVLAVIAAQGELGLIPADAAEKILRQAKYNIAEIKELESSLRHETYAFLMNVTSYLPADCRKYLHYGLTSSDLLDTALSIKLQHSAQVILTNLAKTQATLKDLAFTHKETVCVGRTHGIHAEPYSLGLKFALYYAEFERHRQRLKSEQQQVAIAKISGALGNYAHMPVEVEKIVAKKLNLRTTHSNTQVIPRDHLYYFMTVLVGIAATVEKISVEIRNMQRTEIGEWHESFARTQKGSSAMPHKRNPIASEQLTGLSRVCRSGLTAIAENMILWHERDISHSSVERLILPQNIMLVDYMTDKMSSVLANLYFDEDRIEKNLLLTDNAIYSQRLMLLLVKSGMDRSQAHDLLQKLNQIDFDEDRIAKNLLLSDNAIYSQGLMLLLVKSGMDRSQAHDLLQQISRADVSSCFMRDYAINKSHANNLARENIQRIRPQQKRFVALIKWYLKIKKYLTNEQIDQVFDNQLYLVNVDRIYQQIFKLKS